MRRQRAGPRPREQVRYRPCCGHHCIRDRDNLLLCWCALSISTYPGHSGGSNHRGVLGGAYDPWHRLLGGTAFPETTPKLGLRVYFTNAVLAAFLMALTLDRVHASLRRGAARGAFAQSTILINRVSQSN